MKKILFIILAALCFGVYWENRQVDAHIMYSPSSFAIEPPPQGATYWVDFEGGSDENSGDTHTSAFKHCPGDDNATDTAASTTLVMGDTPVDAGVDLTAEGYTDDKDGTARDANWDIGCYEYVP